MAVVLAIPDLHSPAVHPRALDFVTRLARRVKPDEVVFLGDEADCASWSTHPKDPSMPAPADELRLAVGELLPFYQAFPRARVCVSNHCLRPGKRAAEQALPPEFLREWKEVIKAPRGWRWAEEWRIDGVSYRHGDGFSGKHAPRQAAERTRRSVVIGHLHSVCGVSYLAGPHDVIFGAALGCLIDPAHPAFAYARYGTARPVLAAGVIYDGESVLIERMGGRP